MIGGSGSNACPGEETRRFSARDRNGIEVCGELLPASSYDEKQARMCLTLPFLPFLKTFMEVL
jgi:hypothetical protein